MIREVVCFVVGFAILAADVVDIVWTTLGTHGGGPISTPVTDLVSHIALKLHKRRPHHRLLSFVGSITIVVLLVLWVSMMWGGWFIIFNARPDAIVDSHTHAAADVVGRLYFTAYSISTMGNGDFVPHGSLWRVLTSLATLSGLGTVSMAITFLMNVLPAVVLTRTLGSYISDLGGTPTEIIRRAWDGKNFDSLNDHFLEMTGMIHIFTEQHLAYPVLQYFHSEHERTAASLRLAALNELVILLAHGVVEESRPMPMVILPVKEALTGLATVVEREFVEPAKDPPPPPSLSVLRQFSVPTVSDEQFARALQDCQESRRFFAGLLEDDGWPWERLWTGPRHPDRE